MANEKINEAKREKEIKVMEIEKNKDELVKEKAKELIKKHKRYVGDIIAEKAISKLEKNTNENSKSEKTESEEENKDVNIQEKSRRGRPRRKV